MQFSLTKAVLDLYCSYLLSYFKKYAKCLVQCACALCMCNVHVFVSNKSQIIFDVVDNYHFFEQLFLTLLGLRSFVVKWVRENAADLAVQVKIVWFSPDLWNVPIVWFSQDLDLSNTQIVWFLPDLWNIRIDNSRRISEICLCLILTRSSNTLTVWFSPDLWNMRCWFSPDIWNVLIVWFSQDYSNHW